jgi:hypothetical protein
MPSKSHVGAADPANKSDLTMELLITITEFRNYLHQATAELQALVDGVEKENLRSEKIASNTACDYCVCHAAPCRAVWCGNFKGLSVIVPAEKPLPEAAADLRDREEELRDLIGETIFDEIGEIDYKEILLILWWLDDRPALLHKYNAWIKKIKLELSREDCSTIKLKTLLEGLKNAATPVSVYPAVNENGDLD